MCRLNSPHTPIVPLEKFRGRSQAGGYGDWVAQTDDNVGRILKALEGNGFADNTLVIFSSDNGPEAYAYARIKNFNHRMPARCAACQARRVGGRASGALHCPLAGARETGGQRWTRQPGRRDGHVAAVVGGDAAGEIGARQL